MNAPVSTVAPPRPTFEELTAAVDVRTAATLIVQQGKRRAVMAPTAEIVAMAATLCQLDLLANLTCGALQTGDKLEAEIDTFRRIALKSALRTQVAMIGELLESLGYGRGDLSQPTTIQETTNG